MIKLIEDIINRRKLNKAQMIMLIYGGVFFLLFGIYLYSQINTFNQRVEYVFNIALNDSVYAIKAYSKSEIKLWVKNDSVLIISPLNPIEKNNAFNLFDQGYN